MSQPRWITPKGSLGTIPELDYYEFMLDAYDTAGGTLSYRLISGRLPLGLQVVTTGKLQGVPVSELTGDQNIEYTFTIRVQNLTTLSVADRTFSITVTNVAPPAITPKNVSLGTFLVGTEMNMQLNAVEFTPSTSLTWTLKKGELPPGLSLTADGIITGYITPIPNPASTPNWDMSPWNLQSWEFAQGTISKSFVFDIEVFDGVGYDLSTYTMLVVPRTALEADSTYITADSTIVGVTTALTIDLGPKHPPIITTTQANLAPIRQNSFFTFNVDAVDLDNDVLKYQFYSAPAGLTGAFDEQILVGESNPYIAAQLVSGNLFVGAYPAVQSTILADNVTSISSVDSTIPELLAGANIKVLSTANTWYNATVTNATTVRLSGNVKVTANVGDLITQQISGANATITAVGQTIGTLVLGGANVTANVNDYVTQSISGANARITANIVNSIYVPIEYVFGGFTVGSGNLQINGSNVNVYPTSSAVTTDISCTYNTVDTFNLNLSAATAKAFIANVDTLSYPTAITSVGVTLGTASVEGTFGFDETKFDQVVSLPPGGEIIARTTYVATGSSNTTFKVTSTANVVPGLAVTMDSGLGAGIIVANVVDATTVTLSANPSGTPVDGDPVIFTKESGLSIDENTGWITGQLPYQQADIIEYPFEVIAYKRDDPTYYDTQAYSLTILGDQYNQITWITPSDLGTIENGNISDLLVEATSSKGSTLFYKLAANSSQRLPQGLQLLTTGLISGRVSFEIFSLDQGTTTIDGGNTTFDNTYTFTVTAYDASQQALSNRTFTITVLNRNTTPFEHLYLKALPTKEQRDQFQNIVHNTAVFPPEMIYRSDDPYFGLATDIKFLFLPGLAPSTLAEYMSAVGTNHFTKRITFGDVKTAVARDSNFNVKYEVVYVEVKDENTNSLGQGPANTQYPEITTPYYDAAGSSFTIAYPDAFSNMKSVVETALGYANKGALPDWMTSRQENGRVLGFTKGVILAYTVPGASDLIAYRFKQQNYKLNEIDFTVDRYLLDNDYSANFDITNNKFITSTETTFDRYPGLSNTFTDVGTVDYALSVPFEWINKRSVTDIQNIANDNPQDPLYAPFFGGLDGIMDFRDGDTLVFARQEFNDAVYFTIPGYNYGWADVQTMWDSEAWDHDPNIVDLNPGTAWDQSSVIPGYNEHLLDSNVPNKRIGVWRVNIDASNIVTLTFIQEINFYNSLYVRNGFTYGGTRIYYDSVVKPGLLLPNYSIITQQINVQATTFDGNGTRFYSYRDMYHLPEEGDKYIKFVKHNVFT